MNIIHVPKTSKEDRLKAAEELEQRAAKLRAQAAIPDPTTPEIETLKRLIEQDEKALAKVMKRYEELGQAHSKAAGEMAKLEPTIGERVANGEDVVKLAALYSRLKSELEVWQWGVVAAQSRVASVHDAINDNAKTVEELVERERVKANHKKHKERDRQRRELTAEMLED
ncbi:MAG: hypothetical protein M1570_18625 [Chloroflexi bacterium]|nr:hypothetical protein [Chloroflexota bacterium]